MVSPLIYRKLRAKQLKDADEKISEFMVMDKVLITSSLYFYCSRESLQNSVEELKQQMENHDLSE